MADPTKPAGGEARPDFETLLAAGAGPARDRDVDAPKNRHRHLANRHSEPPARDRRGRHRRKAELTVPPTHQSILTGTSEIERAFAAIAPDILVRQLGALRANVLGSKGKPK